MSNNGQTIADRLAAARHVIDGSTVNKAVVKATTHEIQGPKVKFFLAKGQTAATF